MTARLAVRPIDLRDANAFITLHHRHHKPVRGHRWSIGVWLGEQLVGIAICGRPVARMTDQRNVLEVTRLCTDGTKNSSSILYAAAARAAQAMGYQKIQTFILVSESGVTLKAAGWELDGYTKGRDWNTPSRGGRRTDQPMEDKQRWAKIFRPAAGTAAGFAEAA